jgi:hypothetical protein
MGLTSSSNNQSKSKNCSCLALGDLAHYVELIFAPQILATVLVVRRQRCHHLSATLTTIIAGILEHMDFFAAGANGLVRDVSGQPFSAATLRSQPTLACACEDAFTLHLGGQMPSASPI